MASKKAAKKMPAQNKVRVIRKRKSPNEKILKAISGLTDSNEQLVKAMEKIEKRLDFVTAAETELFKVISANMSQIIKNQGVFYTKFLLTRLNMIELSEGRAISVSRNEHRELENSRTATPDKKVASLPQLVEARIIDKKWLN